MCDTVSDLLLSSQGRAVVLVFLLMIGVGWLLWWISRHPGSRHGVEAVPPPEFDETVVRARSLFSSEESTLLNLVMLAVRDHFLVLGKLSLLQLVSFREKDEDARRTVMRMLQASRFDLVLLHPGTRQARTVIRFRQEQSASMSVGERERLVDLVLKAAGITLVELSLEQTYSVAQLESLLGVAEDETSGDGMSEGTLVTR